MGACLERMSRTRPNILITGTPGCGKTTTADLVVTLSSGAMRHIEVSKLVEEKGLHDGRDEERGCWFIDDDALCDELEDPMSEGGIILDTHCCIDYFPERWFDLVVVLRCDTNALYSGWRDAATPRRKSKRMCSARSCRWCLRRPERIIKQISWLS